MTGGGGAAPCSLHRNWSWPRAIFYAGSIALCIAVDILQYAMPLPFLPQQLEDRGHSPMHITATIGGYYWMGMLGGAIITSGQIWRVLFHESRELTWTDIKRSLVFLIIGLMLGTVTLVLEAFYNRMAVHLICRLTQGFLGAFLFFYSYLLSIVLFTGKQQRFALTCATAALNVAEVFGPFVGGAVYTTWGARTSFLALAAASMVNQVLLVAVIWSLPSDDPEQASRLGTPTPATREPVMDADEQDGLLADPSAQPPLAAMTMDQKLDYLRCLSTSPHLMRTVIIMAPAAMVKGCLENILPFFADKHLLYTEFQVGLLFLVIALGFLSASITCNLIWDYLSKNARVYLVGFSLSMLGVFSGTLLVTYGALASVTTFYIFLGCYGASMGFCMTPAAYILGDYIEELEDAQAKDAANGIWNTMWEVGGSLGFFVAGFVTQSPWIHESLLLALMASVLIGSSFGFIHLTGDCDKINPPSVVDIVMRSQFQSASKAV